VLGSHVTIGVQPGMGVPGDPMKLLFDRSFTPHHQYAAFYTWIARGFKADAVITSACGSASGCPAPAGLTGSAG
jgi:magnesium chelatase subunit H